MTDTRSARLARAARLAHVAAIQRRATLAIEAAALVEEGVASAQPEESARARADDLLEHGRGRGIRSIDDVLERLRAMNPALATTQDCVDLCEELERRCEAGAIDEQTFRYLADSLMYVYPVVQAAASTGELLDGAAAALETIAAGAATQPAPAAALLGAAVTIVQALRAGVSADEAVSRAVAAHGLTHAGDVRRIEDFATETASDLADEAAGAAGAADPRRQ